MSTTYRLVPLSMWQQLMESVKASTVNSSTNLDSETKRIVETSAQQEEKTQTNKTHSFENIDDAAALLSSTPLKQHSSQQEKVINMLPKRLRSRASIVLDIMKDRCS